MAIWKLGGLALASVLGSGLLFGQASAMPAANGMATVASKVGNGTEQVRWAGGGWRGMGMGMGWRGAGWRGVGWRGITDDGHMESCHLLDYPRYAGSVCHPAARLGQGG